MIRAIVDTNVLLRGAISANPKSASKQVLDALFAKRITLLLSPATFKEIQRVLAEDDIRALHGWTDEKLKRFFRALELRADFLEPTSSVSASVTRDLTDTNGWPSPSTVMLIIS